MSIFHLGFIGELELISRVSTHFERKIRSHDGMKSQSNEGMKLRRMRFTSEEEYGGFTSILIEA